MRVKTYRGFSTAGVLEQVKAELGSDAVILDTQTSKIKGRTVCEITAALEHEPVEADMAPTDGPAPGWGQWHQEWDQIKAHFMALMKTQLDLSDLAPRQRMALEHLEREGVGQGAIMALWKALKDDPRSSVLSPLAKMVKAKAFTPDNWQQRWHALAGPAGVGKTTTLFRLALAHKNARPRDRVMVVNADNLHAKGRLFLKHYAELSGISYAETASPKDTLELVRSAGKFDRIFVDLPGASGHETLQELLDRLGLDAISDMTVHLALSPCYAPAQMDAFLRRYASRRTRSIIWTKLDEACIFGAMVNTAYASGLPASILSFGPGLKDSMSPAEPVDMWRLIFKRELPGSGSLRAPEPRTAQ